MITRKCVVTGKIVPIENLVRFVLKKDGSIFLETNKKIYGRGAYCLNQKEIIDLLFKKKILNKSFRRNISNDLYEKLREEVNNYVKE